MTNFNGIISKALRQAAVLSLIAFFSGCVIVRKTPIPPEPPPGANVDLALPIPQRGGTDEWGLALSGGGIRSAAFAIGVMKSLFDQGYLDRVDAISSVSGGGYAAYWLYSQYDPSEKPRFGASVFDDSVWARVEALLQFQAKFAPTQYSVSRLPLPPQSAADLYEGQIAQFGNTKLVSNKLCFDKDRANRKFSDIQKLVGSEMAPLPIMEATLETQPITAKDEQRSKFGRERIWQMSPSFRGNAHFGYYPWTGQELRYSQAAAISGAAVKLKLAQHVDSPIPGAAKLTLWDGGGGSNTENLGAYSLVSRGLANVIIIDAEKDSDYDFVAYEDLQRHLHEERIDFRVPAIEAYFEQRKKDPKAPYSGLSVEFGEAKRLGEPGRPPVKTRVFYIKMSRPATIFGKPVPIEGRERLVMRDQLLRPDGRLTESRIQRLEGFVLTEGMYRAAVNDYAHYLDNSRWKLIKYTFPHITTIDQSFYNDQMEALIGLGYLQASELSAADRLNKN